MKTSSFYNNLGGGKHNWKLLFITGIYGTLPTDIYAVSPTFSSSVIHYSILHTEYMNTPNGVNQWLLAVGGSPSGIIYTGGNGIIMKYGPAPTRGINLETIQLSYLLS